MISAIGGGLVVLGTIINIVFIVGCLTMYEKVSGEKHEFWGQVVVGFIPAALIVLGMWMAL